MNNNNNEQKINKSRLNNINHCKNGLCSKRNRVKTYVHIFYSSLKFPRTITLTFPEHKPKKQLMSKVAWAIK